MHSMKVNGGLALAGPETVANSLGGLNQAACITTSASRDFNVPVTMLGYGLDPEMLGH